MEYLLSATTNKGTKGGEFKDCLIKVSIDHQGNRDDSSIVFSYENVDFWIPMTEFDELIQVLDNMEFGDA